MLHRIRSKASSKSFGPIRPKSDSRSPHSDGGGTKSTDKHDSSRSNGSDPWTSSLEAEFDRMRAKETGMDARRSTAVPPPPLPANQTSTGSSRTDTSSIRSERRERNSKDSSRENARLGKALNMSRHGDTTPLSHDSTGGGYRGAKQLMSDDSMEDRSIYSLQNPSKAGSISSSFSNSSVDSRSNDFFKVHYVKTGPVPPARKGLRGRVTTTSSSSPTSHSTSTRGSEDSRGQKRCDDLKNIGTNNELSSNLSDGIEGREEVTSPEPTTPHAPLPRGAIISRATSSNFDTTSAEATKDETFGMRSISDFTEMTPRVERTQESALPSMPTPIYRPPTEDLREKFKLLLATYNASVQQATDMIYSSAVESKEGGTMERTNSKEKIPELLRPLGLKMATVPRKQAILKELLQNLIHLHFYTDIVEVFCFASSSKEDFSASSLLRELQSKISLRSLLTYRSQTYSMLLSTISPQANLHHSSQVLTRLHAQIGSLFVWSGILTRPSDAASHTMKGYGKLKLARDQMVALMRGIRECTGEDDSTGWFEVTVESGQKEKALPVEEEDSGLKDNQDLASSMASTSTSSSTSSSPPTIPPVLVQDFASPLSGGNARRLLTPPASSLSSSKAKGSNLTSNRRKSGGRRSVTFEQTPRGSGEGEGGEEKARASSPVYMVVALGLTLMPTPPNSSMSMDRGTRPSPPHASKSDDRVGQADTCSMTLRQLMEIEGREGGDKRLEVLLEADGKWV